MLFNLLALMGAQALAAGNSSGGGMPPPPSAFIFYVPGAQDGDAATLPALAEVRAAAAEFLLDGKVRLIRVGEVPGGHVSAPTRQPAICVDFIDYAGLDLVYTRFHGQMPEGVSLSTANGCQWLDAAAKAVQP